jgi:hypothetical protein
MKIRIYEIDLSIPRHVKPGLFLFLVGIPLLVLFGIVAIAYASITTFKPGDPLSSATMNGNFSDLDKRVTALEGLVDAGVPLPPKGAIVWKDSKGAIIPVVRPLGDEAMSGGAGSGPQGQLEIYDQASNAVWMYLITSTTVSVDQTVNWVSLRRGTGQGAPERSTRGIRLRRDMPSATCPVRSRATTSFRTT